MAAERVVLNPDGQPTAKAAAQAGGVKAMQHEQRATVREEQLHEVARSRRRVDRLRDEVVRQVRSVHRREALHADLRLELRGGVQNELARVARERSHAVDLADLVATFEELAESDRLIAYELLHEGAP